MQTAFSTSALNGLEEMLVSCWHMNNYESAAMWKVYAKSDESIAIVTDYPTLKNVLPPYCCLGIVNYVDYENHIMDFRNGFSYITHKRKSFEHEREIRAVLWTQHLSAILDHPVNQTPEYNIPEMLEVRDVMTKYGTFIPLDLGTLIKAVYINPGASDHFSYVVKGIVERFGYGFQVINSSISGQPVY